MRTFIAINLDEEIKKTLNLLIDELSKNERKDRNIRWIKPKGMHLTLKFLGEISPEKVSEIENVLRKTVKKFNSFILKVKGTGYFPPFGKRPRVFWVGIEEDKNLMTLQAQIEEELEKLDFPREQRKFHPHLTLGRVKNYSNLRETLSLVEHYRERSFGEMKVKKITFFRSILKPTGAEYSVLSEFELK